MELVSRSGINGGGLSDPLLLFPAEIWEYILRNLDDSRDILNVIKAFPVLDGLVLKNKYWWLLDQVLPNIFPYMGKHEVLSCRRICLRWTQAVDNFLEKFPTQHDHELKLTSQLRIPDPSQYHTPQHMFARRFQATSSFPPPNMDGSIPGGDVLPPRRNPIVGRSLVFSDEGIHENLPVGGGRLEYGEELFIRSVCFWNMAAEYIRSLGDRVWFLNLNFGYFVSLGRIRSVLTDFLHALPNLKMLSIDDLDYDLAAESENRYDGEWLKEELSEGPHLQLQPLPQLPHLECLQFSDMPGYISGLPQATVNLLMASYSSQICKLEIDYRYLRNEFWGPFPKLTELILSHCYDKPTARNLLLSLDAPELRTLSLEYGGCDQECCVNADADDIISCLRRFTKLSKFKLILEFDQVERRGGSQLQVSLPLPPPARDFSIPSLKSFEIACSFNNDMEFGFVQRFPFLEHLQIAVQFGYAYKSFYESFKFDNFFEMLPKLKKVILPPHPMDYQHQHRSFSFTRAKYELAKRSWGLVEASPSPCVLDALRASCFPWNELGQPQNFHATDADSEAREIAEVDGLLVVLGQPLFDDDEDDEDADNDDDDEEEEDDGDDDDTGL